MAGPQALSVEIRNVLKDLAGIDKDPHSLDDDADLYAAGMTSFASVNVMLELEDRLGIMFPETMLKRSTFRTINAIAASVEELRATSLD
jgi:acyl carrier protein